jgi:hypothetical protein
VFTPLAESAYDAMQQSENAFMTSNKALHPDYGDDMGSHEYDGSKMALAKSSSSGSTALLNEYAIRYLGSMPTYIEQKVSEQSWKITCIVHGRDGLSW